MTRGGGGFRPLPLLMLVVFLASRTYTTLGVITEGTDTRVLGVLEALSSIEDLRYSIMKSCAYRRNISPLKCVANILISSQVMQLCID